MDAQEFWDDYQHLKKEASKLRDSEARLKQIRARHRALVDGHLVPILVIGKDAVLLEINPAAERVLDLDPDTAGGTPLRDLFSDAHSVELADRAEDAIASQSIVRFHWLLNRLGGPVRQFGVSLLPVVDETRQTDTVICLAREITDLLALEEELDRNSEHLAQMLEETRRLRDRVLDELDQARR